MNISEVKKDVKNFLKTFEVVVDPCPTFSFEGLKGHFNQLLSTREQYVDLIVDYLDHISDLEMMIITLKSERRGFLSPIMQKEYENVKKYATTMYRFRRAMKDWRRNVREASYENTSESLLV